jgi:type VI protein secretion system component Hcp
MAASADGVYTAAGPVSTQLVVDKATPTLSIASISNKLTTADPFSVSVTSPSGGVKTYSSSHPQFASIDSSTGLVTLVSGGTTTITVNMAASADGVYTAAGPVSTQLVVDKATPTLSIASISNKLTTADPFSVSVTSPSSGVKTYSSSHPQFASINSSTGIVTLVSGGTTTITVNMAASADGVYAAAGPVSTQLVVDKATPTLSIASISDKLTTADPFSVSELVTKSGTGVLAYSSSNPQFASINSSTGLVTLVSSGTTTITVNMAASADGVYTAAGPVSTQLVVTAPAPSRGFFVLTDNSDFSGLDFDSGMSTLFSNTYETVAGFGMPNSNFMFNNTVYELLYLSNNGWLSFGTNPGDVNYGRNSQAPQNTFRFFSQLSLSSVSYKFDSNNTRLLIKFTGIEYFSRYTETVDKTFTIKLIITQSGEIRTNYTISSNFTSTSPNSNPITIGYVGSDTTSTTDDTYLTLSGVTFQEVIGGNPYSLLNGKSILYIH